MPANFNWQAEDDNSWDEYIAPEKPQLPKNNNGMKIVLASIVIMSVAVISFLLIRELTDRIATTEISVETDILTSQDLVLQAVHTGDPEVLVSVLSGREEEWTSAVVSLLEEDLLYDRKQFGLEWDPSVRPSNVEVSIEPDLRGAEVRFTLAYTQKDGSGENRQVELQHTSIFRTSDDRWLLAPALQEFWGDRISAEGRYVTVEFPEADADLGRRLAADLEEALGEACSSLPGIECPDTYHLKIDLTPDPSVLIAIANPDSRFEGGDELALPTPTLMGIPTDIDAYRALQMAYAELAVRRLINDVSDWECCDQSVFYEALMDSQLAQLGYQTWLANPGDYLDALREPLTLSRLAQIWDDPQPLEELDERSDKWLVHSFVEFLSADRIGASGADMQRFLTASVSFSDWVHQINKMEYAADYVEESWNDYILNRIDAWQGQPQIPLPNQKVALICDEGNVGSSNLYVYDPEADSWSLSLTNHEFVHMSSIPGGAGILFSDQLYRPERIETIVYRDDQEYVVDEGRTTYRLTGRANSQGVVGLSSYDSQSLSGGHFLLDINSCESGSCPIEPISASLRWSPSGQRSLFIDAAQGQMISAGDIRGDSSVVLGEGRDPFWMSEDIIGYIRTMTVPDVVSSTISSPTPQVLVQSADISTFLTGTNPIDIVIMRATIQPAEPHRIVVAAGNRAGNQTYLVAYDWKNDETTLIYETVVAASGLTSISFSPNGRWLLIRSPTPDYQAGLPTYDVRLYDFESGEMQTLLPADGTISPALDWSADSKWLLHSTDGKLILTAPEEKYQYLVLHGLHSCRGAAWTNSP